MIAPSEYGHHQGSSGSSVRFPNPANLESSAPASSQSSSSSYNAFAGNNAPYPRCNTNALRRSRHFVPNECKDEYYWHKRLKNNEAARKSRQKRRNIDSVLEEKVLVLSHENDMLRNELYNLKVRFFCFYDCRFSVGDFLTNYQHFSSESYLKFIDFLSCLPKHL